MMKIVLKDLKLFFKDRKALLLTFLLPLVLATLFAFAFGGVGRNTNADKEYDLPVCDLDSSSASKMTILVLDSLKTLHVVPVQLSHAQNDIKKGNIDCVLILHKGFSDSLNIGNPLPVELQYDESKEMQIGMLQQSLIPTLSTLPYKNTEHIPIMMKNMFGKMMGKRHNETEGKVNQQFDELYQSIGEGIEANPNANQNTGFSMNAQITMTKLVSSVDDNTPGLVQAIGGVAVMMLLFSVTGVGTGLLDERQEGTLKKLLYSPIRPNQILFGKMLSANIISIAQLTVMFCYASFAFGLKISNHWPSLLLMIIGTAFACSAFGVFVASIAQSRQQAQSLSTLIILIVSAIGGSMIPIFFMPAIMQKIAVISPNYWAMQGFFDIFWRNLYITDSTFLTRVAVLLFIGIVLNLIALYFFKKNIVEHVS